MKKNLLLFPIIFFCIVLINGCKKNTVSDKYTETVNPVIPDLITQVNTGVDGFITDEQGNAVSGASVKGGIITVITDNYGYFRINSTAFAKAAGFIQVTKPGYFTGYRTFIPIAGKKSFIRLQLIPKTITGSINATTGGTVNTTEGATVNLPANAVVIASTNIVYTGNVNVYMHWLDPSDQQNTPLLMPGDLRGIDAEGYLNTLTTYGMLAVELYSDAGSLLQVADGKKVALNFPIPASLQSTAPASIPLWYFDVSNGLWKEDGTAIRSGNNYKADVSHFTFWNCDVPASLVNFTVQLLDMSLNPLSNTAVSISINGIPNSGRIDFTDTSGRVSGMIPANSNLVMKVITTCNNSVFIQQINTTNTDVNLGSIKVDLQQYATQFNGTVNKCSGAPVTDGYVIIAGVGYNHIINLQNGVFNASVLVCPNANATIVAIDRGTSEQSLPQNIAVVTGTNNVGTLSACNPVVENITYTLDGVTTTLSLPQHMFIGNYGIIISNTEIKAIDLLNGSVIVFQMNFISVDAPGSYVFSGFNLDRAYEFVNPTSVVITTYGLVSQFITGSFSGQVRDMTNSSLHTFSCSFQVRRDT